MNYTIKHATSTRQPSIFIDLDKNGNKFMVSVWLRGIHRTIERMICNTFDGAENAFTGLCDKYEMTHITDIDHSWDAADFD